MIKARIPKIIEVLYKGAVFRLPEENKKTIYLTFDDGPVPEATPAVLDILKQYKVKATFFCVGENVQKHPEIYKRILAEGHSVGNHTFNHMKGWENSVKDYYDNTQKCAEFVKSNLFRPPYGRIGLKQFRKLKKEYKIVFWDVLSVDYDKNLSANDCLDTLKKYTRPGSIIVFHDSVKTMDKIGELLSKSLDFIISEGYEPKAIPMA